MCKKEKYEKHRNVLVFFLNLRNARYSYFSGTVLRNPKHYRVDIFHLYGQLIIQLFQNLFFETGDIRLRDPKHIRDFFLRLFTF